MLEVSLIMQPLNMQHYSYIDISCIASSFLFSPSVALRLTHTTLVYQALARCRSPEVASRIQRASRGKPCYPAPPTAADLRFFKAGFRFFKADFRFFKAGFSTTFSLYAIATAALYASSAAAPSDVAMYVS